VTREQPEWVELFLSKAISFQSLLHSFLLGRFLHALDLGFVLFVRGNNRGGVNLTSDSLKVFRQCFNIANPNLI
jgi:hypothetical protein